MAAAIDRIVHHSVILEFDVPSYRTDAAQNRRIEEELDRQKWLTRNIWDILPTYVSLVGCAGVHHHVVVPGGDGCYLPGERLAVLRCRVQPREPERGACLRPEAGTSLPVDINEQRDDHSVP